MTASKRAITSSVSSSGSPNSSEAPSRFMRAPVDSSAEHDARLDVLARALELLLGGGLLAQPRELVAARRSIASPSLSGRVPT